MNYKDCVPGTRVVHNWFLKHPERRSIWTIKAERPGQLDHLRALDQEPVLVEEVRGWYKAENLTVVDE